MLQRLLRGLIKTVTSQRRAESRRTAAETGKVKFEKPVNTNVTNNKKRFINVKFSEHVGGTKMLTDKGVFVIVDQQHLLEIINNLCDKTKFLGKDLRVSSASLSRSNKNVFWSVVHSMMGHSVNVDDWLQKRLLDPNWEHLDQALPPRKC